MLRVKREGILLGILKIEERSLKEERESFVSQGQNKKGKRSDVKENTNGGDILKGKTGGGSLP